MHRLNGRKRPAVNVGDLSEGVFSSAQWTKDVNWPGAKDFAARYLARFGQEPTYHAAVAAGKRHRAPFPMLTPSS
jgi:hypothetical protein